MDGWIKVHRKLLKSSVWIEADAEGKVILLTLLLRACHAPALWPIGRGKTVMLQPGEIWLSNRHFAKTCGVTVKKMRFEVNRLAAADFLRRTAMHDGSVVHVVNWDIYQGAQGPQKGPQKGPPSDTAFALDTRGSPASAKEPQGPQKGPPKGPQNKTVNNNNIKTKQTGQLLSPLAAEPNIEQALKEYKLHFPGRDAVLDRETLNALRALAASSGTVWAVKAVRELKAVSAEKQIRSPQRYLRGIIANWQRDGIIDTHKADEKELLDFYREEGIT